jgi:VanZ family protein
MICKLKVSAASFCSKDRLLLFRLALAVLLFFISYRLASFDTVRDWYRDVDKIVHAIAFAFVYVVLAWASRLRPLVLAGLSMALGAGVEFHQYFLPGFTSSIYDWLADAFGISLVCLADLFFRHQSWLTSSGLREPPQSTKVQHALPESHLICVDWVLTNCAGDLLLGQRLQGTTRGSWLTPSGIVQTGELLNTALQRVAKDVLGMSSEIAAELTARGEPMGGFDNLRSYSTMVPTPLVHLPFFARLTEAEVEDLRPVDHLQRHHWQWLPLANAIAVVQSHEKHYVSWLHARAVGAHSTAPSSISKI